MNSENQETKEEPKTCPRCGKEVSACQCSRKNEPKHERVAWEQMADTDDDALDNSDEENGNGEETPIKYPHIPDGPQEEIRFAESLGAENESEDTESERRFTRGGAIAVIVALAIMAVILILVVVFR